MSMPRDLVLLRHGESEGNVVSTRAKGPRPDLSGYTDSFVTTPGHRWRLTELGRSQAAAMGAWLSSEFQRPGRPGEPSGGGGGEGDEADFDRYLVSPYVRTRETAGHLGLENARWLMSRAVRERDWGDIGSMPRSVFADKYADNAAMKARDPLYWVPPGGESIAQVAEDRVRNTLSTLHRECSMRKVLIVTHGEFMWATRLVLERWNDEEFARRDSDPADRIANCQVVHYTRTDPSYPEDPASGRLSWVRTAEPVLTDTGWTIAMSPWSELVKPTLGNAELIASIADVRSLL